MGRTGPPPRVPPRGPFGRRAVALALMSLARGAHDGQAEPRALDSVLLGRRAATELVEDLVRLRPLDALAVVAHRDEDVLGVRGSYDDDLLALRRRVLPGVAKSEERR